jgi:hypothetical protein
VNFLQLPRDHRPMALLVIVELQVLVNLLAVNFD